ncbi:MAG: prolyl oligopeptidase family serine peptidase [Bacteroidales bacterium]|nr:prolyl oligopeptidase family serine peptidase [Bacteroidales bacterium]
MLIQRMGAVGARNGGYSVFYLAGVPEGRFKAFVSHCGVFNFESEYGSTEEIWFPDKDYGGPYWKTRQAINFLLT